MKEFLTALNDRVLRFDGVSVIEPDQVEELLRSGGNPANIRVLFTTPAIEQFNANVIQAEQLKEFEPEPITLQFNWNIPQEFLSLDIDEHVSTVFGKRLSTLKYDSAQTEIAIARVVRELSEFKHRGLDDLLRTIIFILHKFSETNQVWGVGRGSSCASFILFLLGLHVVDPIRFDVPIEEFFHGEDLSLTLCQPA